MKFELVLFKEGKTTVHYRGRHPISGHVIDLYIPYDQHIKLDDPPDSIEIEVTING